MTIIIGIHCRDGIVIAGDSALTINSNVEQTYSEKITCINNNILIGFSGDLGTAQRFKKRMEYDFESYIHKLEKSLQRGLQPFEMAKLACQIGINEFMDTQPFNVTVNVSTSFLVGFFCKDQHLLFLLQAGQLQPVIMGEDLSFASIGCGNYITNPFLSFIKDVFWVGKQVPDVSIGIFSSLMALDLAIKTNAGGINGPIHVAVIRKDNQNVYSCQKLHEDELSDHLTNCKLAMKYFSGYRHTFDSDSCGAHSIPTLTNSQLDAP